ncbi:serine/threonine-protein phosphatase PGAM5, mitochondrial isoform X2 [Carassius auratus]|uniref:Serine/threonine-protein phosphatase PGAM5, mitochondrial n=1 Tax=Carassius auratus TaxID=7957 RepID=A0A6P6K4G2_CARAU|nr:serine/threonine-protein phosphatase PGAM5, mitochondrial isoform X2 [Carassius auratus]XP_026066750.1 serine/threonine-protein phosphatase PGAM5, mitochondrial isoform X2 [Carassius auratus]
MSFRRAISLACGFAGGSAVLVCAAVAADKHGYFADRRRLRETLAAVHAAQPPAWPTANGWDYNWDKRDPSSLVNGKRKESTGDGGSPDAENSKPKATRHIFLIRHSQYNLKGDGDKERILTPLGREQAEYTGQRLAALGLKYDVLIHSSMTRATETASIISKHLPDVELVSCDLLREGAPIEPVPPVTHWKPEAVYHEDGARIEAAFRRYIHRADAKQKEDSYEIIVCHANVIRYFVCRALQFPPEGWLRMGLNNGSITWLTIRPSGRVGLRALGDSGFMPPDKLTRT